MQGGRVMNKSGSSVYREEVELDEMTQGKEYTQAQLQKKIQSGNWEATHDIKPGKHVEMRHHTGKKVMVQVKEDLEQIDEGAYEKSEENKRSADAAKKQGDMFAHHLHMADHHENLSQWHSSKGRHGEADKHAEKAEEHQDLAMKHKVKKEEVAANNVGDGKIAGTQGDAGKKSVMTKPVLKRKVVDFKEFVENLEEGKPGLWANIHAKRKRIASGSGERMRKPGSKGAPTAQDFKDSQSKNEDVEAQFDMIEEMIEELALLNNVDSEKIWEDLESIDDEELLEAAIDAKGHKSSTGGLTQKGVDAYNRKTGGNLQTAVTTPPSKLKPGSKAANRRKSFCARMGGMKKRLTSAKTANDPDSRINKALRKWNC